MASLATSITGFYDAEMKGTVVKLVLTLRDRTVRAKLLMITVPVGDRFEAFATTVPGVVFELECIVEPPGAG